MPRPILDERITVRISGVMLTLLLRAAARRNSSLNDVVNTALENDFTRMAGFSADFYLDIMPLLNRAQGDSVHQALSKTE